MNGGAVAEHAPRSPHPPSPCAPRCYFGNDVEGSDTHPFKEAFVRFGKSNDEFWEALKDQDIMLTDEEFKDAFELWKTTKAKPLPVKKELTESAASPTAAPKSVVPFASFFNAGRRSNNDFVSCFINV